jgi:hypothetical protein
MSTPTPRLLTIMGSGETAPTMVKVHRAVLDRLGPPPVPAVLLDTPYAFQENAPELCQKIQHYFAESLRTDITVASGNPEAGFGDGDPFADERLVSAVRTARYVFAGPGSPTYALRRWAATIVPSLMREKLQHGGGVTFSSAAALTLGVATVPVYEIYKVGEDPRWLEGLDILSETGLLAAVIPHYNNAEGGTHDTRYCYLGERRLSALEPELPEGAFVLGVDEHTAVTFDLDAREAVIAGLGVVTVRAAGQSVTFESGKVLAVDDILRTVGELRVRGAGRGSGARAVAEAASFADGAEAAIETGADVSDSELAADAGNGGSADDLAPPAATAAHRDSPLIAEVREQEAVFSSAVDSRDLHAAVGALLTLDHRITVWANDIPSGDAMDRAKASFRSLIVELGKIAETGARDPRDVLGPFVNTLLELRALARGAKRFDESDLIRDRLGDLGIEVRDTPDGTEWVLA